MLASNVFSLQHVALNPKVTRRPYGEILDELASEVLPYMHHELEHA